ncbi:serine hydrolase domain-containing protein [Lacticaseibacillus paracasei]|uniref:serine hydrolase domain-containing protein n=1 Tax=Lacticaseibacillus paracasei TaxID=1597 RepID=UPI0014036E28|nr:serine hydrolase domain-containing protein [Lacticaseibacillus paracasei]
MSGKHRYIWLGVMLILCAVSIGAGTYLWQQNSRSPVNTKAKSAKTVTKAVRQDRGRSKEEILAMTLDRAATTTEGQPLEQELTNDKFIGSALIIKHGKVVFNNGVGDADTTTHRRNGPTTLFQIGSIQKAVTAVALAQLAASGKLSLDDPVGKYLTGIKTGDQVTLRMMVAMRSGFSLRRYQPTVMDDANIIQWSIANLTYLPQDNYAYQAVNYVLLAGVIEKVAGRSYEQQVKNNIFDRLNLKHTGFLPAMLTDPERAITYTGPAANPYQTAIGEPAVWYNRELGTGNVYTSTGDLYRLLRGIDTGKVLPLSTLKTLRNRNDGVYNAGIYNHADFYSTNGVVAGQMASTAISHDGQNAVILLSNYNSHALNLHDLAVHLFSELG